MFTISGRSEYHRSTTHGLYNGRFSKAISMSAVDSTVSVYTQTEHSSQQDEPVSTIYKPIIYVIKNVNVRETFSQKMTIL